MTTKIAIIGDLFMLPSAFEDAVTLACAGKDLEIRTRQDAWPDEPMEHGYAVAGMDGLKEYFGTADDVVEFVGDAEILITQLAPMSRGMFERLPHLKMIAVSRGGPVNIDMKAAKDHGVLVVNTPGRNSSAVAEFTLGAILSETRRIRAGHEALRAGTWRGDLYRADVTGRELSEMTVGVIGYGAIGTKVVRLLRAFGTRVLVCDPYVQLSPEDARDEGVSHVDFDTLLAQSDVVTLHSRVTDETRGMMNKHAPWRCPVGGVVLPWQLCLRRGQSGAAQLAFHGAGKIVQAGFEPRCNGFAGQFQRLHHQPRGQGFGR